MTRKPGDDLSAKPTKPIFNLVGAELHDKRRYNSSRDVAYFYPQLMKAVVDGFAHYESDPPMLEYMKATGVTPDDLVQVTIKYGELLSEVVNGRAQYESPFETAKRVGFEQTNPLARYLLMGRIGFALFGVFHASFMDAFVSGIRPTLTEYDIRKLIEDFFTAYKTREKIVVRPEPAADAAPAPADAGDPR